MMLLDAIVLAGLVAVLVLAILFDLRKLRLPDGLSLALLALFPLHAIGMADLQAIGMQLGLALAVFALLLLGFAFRLLGGGDVKLISALMLFVPLGQLSIVMLTFSGALVLGVILVLAARRLWRGRRSTWGFLASKKLPMGLSIGLAGLALTVGNAAQMF